MIRRSLLPFAVLLLLGVGSAGAETLLTAFGGVATGGDTTQSPGTYGGSLGFLGGGVFGFELEGATTPEFFGGSNGDVFTKNNVFTLMGSMLLAAPAGPARIYGAVGAGLMKTRLDDPDRLFDIDRNEFGMNVGGGLIVYLSDHVGLRADARYFRDLQDNDPDGDIDLDLGNLDYWRFVGGLTIKF